MFKLKLAEFANSKDLDEVARNEIFSNIFTFLTNLIQRFI